MTAHWLDRKTRARRTAVLACRRIRGRHTYDVLAEQMIDIHRQFGIQDKVGTTSVWIGRGRGGGGAGCAGHSSFCYRFDQQKIEKDGKIDSIFFDLFLFLPISPPHSLQGAWRSNWLSGSDLARIRLKYFFKAANIS